MSSATMARDEIDLDRWKVSGSYTKVFQSVLITGRKVRRTAADSTADNAAATASQGELGLRSGKIRGGTLRPVMACSVHTLLTW
eukprot:6138717-Amphidinium_carterae.1